MPDSTAPQLWSVNPYAVAEALLGRRIEWSRGRALLDQLRDIFQIDDPRSLYLALPGQRSLISLFRELQSEGPQRWTVQDCLHIIDAAAELKPLLGRRGVEAMLRALPLLVPLLRRDPESNAASLVREYRTIELPQVAVDRSYRDPAQGAVADCYLIAALIACAWTRPPQWQQRCAAADAGATGFGWSFAAAPAPPRQIATDLQLPVGRDGRLVFARSDANNELWPALLEKAYVLWRRGVAAAAPPSPQPTEAEIQAISIGKPGQATAELLGVSCDMKLNTGQSSLAGRLCSRLAEHAGVTAVPTTASTRQPQHEVWRIDAEAIADVNGQRMDDFIGLTPAHAYAVLGCAEADGRTWVILRDPHSKDLQCPRWLAADAWDARCADGRVEHVFLNRDGVFGLHADDFDRYFDRFDWAETDA